MESHDAEFSSQEKLKVNSQYGKIEKDLWEIQVFSKEDSKAVTGYVRADNASAAICKVLNALGFFNVYKIQVKSRPDAFLVENE